MPLISVIIPVYNVEKYLKDCLESVKSQTFQDFECICIDSESTDKSGEILKEFTEKDHRFIAVTKKLPSVGASRNLGIEKAVGKYICFLDSDDFMMPQTLEYMKIFMETYQPDMVCASFKKVPEDAHFNPDEKFEDINVPHYRQTSIPLADFMEKTLPIESMIWNKFYKTDMVKKTPFVENLHRGEDETFVLEMLHKTKKMLYVPLQIVSYRDRPSSLSKQAISRQYLDSYATILPYLAEKLKTDHPLQKQRQDKFFAKKIYKRYVAHVIDKVKGKEKKEMRRLALEKIALFKQQKILNTKYLNPFQRIVMFFFTHF